MCTSTYWSFLPLAAVLFAASIGCYVVAGTTTAFYWKVRASAAAVVLLSSACLCVGCFQHFYDLTCSRTPGPLNLWMLAAGAALVFGWGPMKAKSAGNGWPGPGKSVGEIIHVPAEDVHPGVQWFYLGGRRVSREEFAEYERHRNAA